MLINETQSAKELREHRAELVPHMRKLADAAEANGGKMTAEQTEKWQKLNANYDALTGMIDKREAKSVAKSRQARVQEIEAEQRATIPMDGVKPGRENRSSYPDRDSRATDEALALAGWVRAHHGKSLDHDTIDAAHRRGVLLQGNAFDIDVRRKGLTGAEYRAQSATTAALGGSTVDSEFVTNFEIALLEFGGVRQVAETIRTEHGGELTWPTANDTSNKGSRVGENTVPATTDVATDSLTLQAYKYTSDLILVPQELLEDSAIDIARYVAQVCAERISRIQNEEFTVGTDASQPNGIVTASTLGVTAASMAAITGDELMELVHSVDPAYRRGPGVGFMLNDQTLLAIRKLKDSNGQYLWQPALTMAEPDRLLGFPATVNQDMADPGASAVSLLFGKLNKYKIRDVRSLRLRRLTDGEYGAADQTAFVAFLRSDGDLLDAGTNPVKHLVHPAT